MESGPGKGAGGVSHISVHHPEAAGVVAAATGIGEGGWGRDGERQFFDREGEERVRERNDSTLRCPLDARRAVW